MGGGGGVETSPSGAHNDCAVHMHCVGVAPVYLLTQGEIHALHLVYTAGQKCLSQNFLLMDGASYNLVCLRAIHIGSV